MSRVVITAQQVKAALEATGYSSIESNVQAVLREVEGDWQASRIDNRVSQHGYQRGCRQSA